MLGVTGTPAFAKPPIPVAYGITMWDVGLGIPKDAKESWLIGARKQVAVVPLRSMPTGRYEPVMHRAPQGVDPETAWEVIARNGLSVFLGAALCVERPLIFANSSNDFIFYDPGTSLEMSYLVRLLVEKNCQPGVVKGVRIQLVDFAAVQYQRNLPGKVIYEGDFVAADGFLLRHRDQEKYRAYLDLVTKRQNRQFVSQVDLCGPDGEICAAIIGLVIAGALFSAPAEAPSSSPGPYLHQDCYNGCRLQGGEHFSCAYQCTY